MEIELIWKEYQNALKRFLHSKISNPADVEDLLQEILIKIYTNLDQLRDQRSIKAWLFQIANHTIIDFYRKSGRQSEVNIENTWYQNDEANEVKAALLSCMVPFIEALPEEQASLITAIDINEGSQKEYAEKEGISYSTLKSRVQKSRSSLKNIFDNCCHFTMDSYGNVCDYNRKK